MITITIKAHDDYSFDPGIKISSVVVSIEKAEWRETYATRLQLDAFIRGAKAVASMTGDMVEIVEET